MDLSKVNLKTETRYIPKNIDDEDRSYGHERTAYLLVLEIPLPGGKAVYEIEIQKDVKDNIEVAAQLANKSK